MSTVNSQDQNDQGKDAKKVLAGFQNNVAKLTAIVKGPQNLKLDRKVSKDRTEDLIAELFQEETEATEVQVKEELKTLLKNYVKLNASLTEERKKLDSIEVAKKKEFNQAASKLFSRIEGVETILKDYNDAFKVAATVDESKVSEDDAETQNS